MNSTATLVADPKEEAVKQLYIKSLMSMTDPYIDVPSVISVGDAIVGTLGNFSAIIGKAKSKKTFSLSAIAASAVSGCTSLGFDVKLPVGKERILVIDTEQGKNHLQKEMVRIAKMAGISTTTDFWKIDYLSLRSNTPAERVEIIDYAIRHGERLGLVVIDGIRDCITDINNAEQANMIVNHLLKWTAEFQIHILTVLHQNKSDENARGHIGSELVNKAESIIQVERDKNQSNVSIVSGVFCRERCFDPFAFVINEDGIPVLAADYVLNNDTLNSRRSFDPARDIPFDKHYSALKQIYPCGNEEYLRYDLEKKIKDVYFSICGQVSDKKAKDIFRYLVTKKLVLHKGNQKSPYILYRNEGPSVFGSV